MFSTLSISLRLAIVSFISVCFTVVALYVIALDVYKGEIINRARTVADSVGHFGKWVAQYKGVWVRNDAKGNFLTEEAFPKPIKVDAPAPSVPDLIKFFSKNPALAQRELSEIVEKSDSKAKFRMTSDNPMNRKNLPTPFEAQAIDVIKQSGVNEYIKFTDNAFFYGRRLNMDKSCLACHASPATAPVDVTSKYGTEFGYGFKENDVAGIISVRIPAEFTMREVSSHLSTTAWLCIALLVGTFFFTILFVHISVVKPVKRLTRHADKISMGERVEELALHENERSSKNEIHKLNVAINRMATSVQIALSRLKSGGGDKSGPQDK